MDQLSHDGEPIKAESWGYEDADGHLLHIEDPDNPDAWILSTEPRTIKQ